VRAKCTAGSTQGAEVPAEGGGAEGSNQDTAVSNRGAGDTLGDIGVLALKKEADFIRREGLHPAALVRRTGDIYQV